MKPKKIKKLTLKKETITNLTDAEMADQKGGATWDLGCLWSAVAMGACSAVGGCGGGGGLGNYDSWNFCNSVHSACNCA